MEQNLKKRIHAMYMQDFVFAWFDVVLLWLAVCFVLYFVLQLVDDNGIKIALMASSFLLLVFNTASIRSMTNHYAEDKDYIYGLDIRHMDANIKAKDKIKSEALALKKTNM